MGTINFVLIGVRNTGKTCYMAAMSRYCPEIQPANDETTQYLKAQSNQLDLGELPQATASTLRELLFQYSKDNLKVRFSTDDYDGSFIESLSQGDSENAEVRNTLKVRIKESEGLFFFMPYETVQDEKALSDFEYEVNTITRLVEEIIGDKYIRLPIPTCLCITKWDLSPKFKHKDEDQYGREYIEQIPTYNRIYAKLNKLFNAVEIFPISAFGLTEDGRHPIKGKMEPHKIVTPIDYCLEKLFPLYEKKISEIQQSNNDAELLAYLHVLYEDLNHYKNGKYCRLYDDLEQEFADQLLHQIEEKKQEALSNVQKSIYACLRRDKTKVAIVHAISKNQSVSRRKKVIRISSMAIIFLLVALSGFYFITQRKAQDQFAQFNNVVKNKKIPVTELIPQAITIYYKWQKPLGLSLEGWFRNDLLQIMTTTAESARAELTKLVQKAQTETSPDVETIQQIKKLMEALSSWPDSNLLQTFQAEINQLDTSKKLLDDLREGVSQMNTLKLDEYLGLKNRVADSVIRWPEMSEQLLLIKQAIDQRIKAIAFKAIQSGNLNSLENSAEELTKLQQTGDTEAGEILAKKLMPVLEKANLERDLAKMRTEINGTLEPDKIIESVKKHWKDWFSQQALMEISDVLQKKFVEIEERALPQDTEISSPDDIVDKRRKINSVKAKTKAVVVVGENNVELFRYQRPDYINNKIIKLEDKLNKYQSAIDHGVDVYVSFKGAGNAKNDPLGFDCSTNDHNISIQFDSTGGIELPESESECLTENTASWKKSIKLQSGVHHITVTERDRLTPNDIWKSDGFSLEESQIIALLNNKEVTINIYPYSLILFTR